MSVKVRAKNPSNILQTLSCDSNGQLNVAFDGLDLSTTNTKLDTVISNTDKTITHLTLLNTTINANSFSSSINLTSHPSEGGNIWGNSDTHHNLILQYSSDNISYFNIKNLNVVNIDSDLTFCTHMEIPPKYIRFYNHHNSSVICNFHIDLIT